QDFDCLLFGTPFLVRNLTSSERRKLPGKTAYTTVHPELIRLQPGLKSLEITREQLVDIAILIGTDFNGGIKGFGPKKSLQLIKKAGSLENALEAIPGAREQLPERDIEMIRKIFLDPEITKEYSIQWSRPDPARVLHIMCDEHQFSRDRIEPFLEKFSSLPQLGKQRNLLDF
ncbi:MAG TPA: flap structure-specific endonuclease, partial [Candidatus Thermoplasmatota archaeon]|nr:flap structure-specific endonuclease [Candidatus Thermoplasmatota archaeon]